MQRGWACRRACLVAQLCPTLCDPMDCSPPGSSVLGDSPGKNIGLGCHFLLQGNSSNSHIRVFCIGRGILPLSHLGSPRARPWPRKTAEEWLEHVYDTIIFLQKLQEAATLQPHLFCFNLIYMETYLLVFILSYCKWTLVSWWVYTFTCHTSTIFF